jgi:hypothetical protein
MRAGKVEGKKFGPTWQINRQSLLEYIEAAERSEDKRRGPKN